MSGTHRIINVPSLAREGYSMCQINKTMAQNDDVIQKNNYIRACHWRHKREIKFKNHPKLTIVINLLIELSISTCTQRCEMCEKINRAKTQIKKIAELPLYYLLKISLYDFERKQSVCLPKFLGKVSHYF